MLEDRNHEYGFVYGAVAVSKVHKDELAGTVQIELKTKHEDIQIRFDKAGRILSMWDRDGNYFKREFT
jgi:hypothetical protein